MSKIIFYFLLTFHIFPLLGCSKLQNETVEIDNKSYINDFELSQNNIMNETVVKITSPKAIINPDTNDIEIFDNLIKIVSNDGKDVLVKSRNSLLNNSTNLIRVFNNVNISLLNTEDYFVNTDSFIWDLNSSNINLDSPLLINLGNTKINSSHGSYNIDSGLLKINNNIFKRSIFNTDGIEEYQITIVSDTATWLKSNNVLEFTSNNKQVETTINFLFIK